MKKNVICTVLMLTVFFVYKTGAQNLENPGEYNAYILKQQENVTKKFLDYNSAVSHGKNAKKVENLREQLLNEVQESRMNISGMPKLKGDGTFRDTAANFLKFYYNVLNDDYSKIVNLEDIEQSYDEMEAYLMLQELVDKKIEEANVRMQKAQKEFAAKNNMTLVASSDEISEKMEKIGNVNEYYHQVYLIFFKCYLQEQNMMKAVGKGNINGIEQDKSALLKYTQEGLKKLETVKAFEGDNGLKGACKQMLQFYEKEANGYMKTVTDYFLIKERFESIEKDFEKKSEPGKKEVDAYNKAVKDINEVSKKYNEASQVINESGTERLNEWNTAVDTFFDEHMPK